MAGAVVVGSWVGAASCAVYGAPDDDTWVEPPITGSGGEAGSSSSVVSSGSTAPQCDTGEPGDLSWGLEGTLVGLDPDICTACISCAMVLPPCTARWEECLPSSGQPCASYLACVDQCVAAADLMANGGNGNGMLDQSGDPMNPSVEEVFADNCIGDTQMPTPPSCIADDMQGFADFMAAMACSICTHCTNNCNAATNCVP